MIGRALDSAAAFAAKRPEATRSRSLRWQDPIASVAEGAGLTGIEYTRAIARGEIPPPPIAVTMNMSVTEIAPGRVVFAGEPGEEHYNPIGLVHGGYSATLLDSAMGSAVHTMLAGDEAYTTLGLEVKFVRPVTRDTGRVQAVGEVIHRGRRQATAEGRLTDVATGKLVATATTTCLIMTP